MVDFWLEAGSFLLRWLHVVAAIAWIGESFYFVMLDRSLRPGPTPRPGVLGELWSVHGGGFYHKQKYLVAPPDMPEDLHWSKWKSYTTWLSGFALLAILYLRDPALYLVDPAVHDWAPSTAAWVALALLPLGWLVYDVLCRLIGFRDQILGIAVGLAVLGLCWLSTHLYAGRAAFLLVGAVMATIMSANVFFVIIPGQRKMVAALARGEVPDAVYGKRGKQRSVHNTYFTLPVVFAMLSTHYGVAHAHPQSWLVLALFMAAGALIRQFFVLWHSGARAWWLLASGAAVLLATLAWLAPRDRQPASARPELPAVTSGTSDAPETVASDDASVLALIQRHCSNCHGSKPSLMASAPQGLVLEQLAQVERQAQRIHQQVVVARAMPLGNITRMSEAERAAIDQWYQARQPR